MAANAEIKVIGLDKLLKKLDGTTLTAPAKALLIRESVQYGKTFLSARVPKGPKNSAAQLSAVARGDQGRISLPFFPLRFVEFGTLQSTGTRSHRRRAAKQWKGGTYRIKPQRFMRRTYAAVRRNLRALIPQAERLVEQEWRK